MVTCAAFVLVSSRGSVVDCPRRRPHRENPPLPTVTGNRAGLEERNEAQQPDAAAMGEAKAVRGKVMDEDGKALAGAEVWLPVVHRANRHVLHAKSEAQGPVCS